jgi:hypothetical protein
LIASRDCFEAMTSQRLRRVQLELLGHARAEVPPSLEGPERRSQGRRVRGGGIDDHVEVECRAVNAIGDRRPPTYHDVCHAALVEHLDDRRGIS